MIIAALDDRSGWKGTPVMTDTVKFHVVIEFEKATGELLGEIYGPRAVSPAARLGWRSNTGVIPDVGETVIYDGMDQHPMVVVRRTWVVHSDGEHVTVALVLGLP